MRYAVYWKQKPSRRYPYMDPLSRTTLHLDHFSFDSRSFSNYKIPRVEQIYIVG